MHRAGLGLRGRVHLRWQLAAAACLMLPAAAHATAVRGQVMFNGLPVPGVTVTATQDGKTVTTSSDEQGNYVFEDLPDGAWQLHVSMLGFEKAEQPITVSASMPGIRWELKMLPLEQVLAQTKELRVAPASAAVAAAHEEPKKAEAPKQTAEAAPPPKPAGEESGQANDGYLVNGSVNNAATSQFSLDRAFGNTRQGSKSLYTGGLGAMWGNSAFDARPYSLTGLDTPKPSYDRLTFIATLGGPLKIPHLMPHGPNFTVVYQWMRNSNASALSGLVPTAAQRAGQLPTGNVSNISPQAQALLALYPLPNLSGNANYNFQVPVVNSTHQDAVQLRMDKGIGRKDQVYGRFASQSTRVSSTNLFGFVDTTDTLGYNASMNWSHRLKHDVYAELGYRTSRLRTLVNPYFANKSNVSGLAGISGNDQDPAYWGPPTLVFSGGVTSLTDGQSAFDRNRTEAVLPSLDWYHGRHNITVGGEFRRQEFNYLSQENPRGTFTFTGAATGNDFADFLAGVPDTSALAFGNADKYLRDSAFNLYGTDDWRIRPDLTLNVGVRWEYEGPISELKQRLVNLDVANGFTAVAQVLAAQPVGALTGQRYPNSLMRPDRNNVEPRLGLSWRPIPGSSLVVRAGYGVYADSSVYQGTALRLAQQAPLSKSISVQASAACPQTLASGFNPCTTTTANTFAVDPNFRLGYAQTWQLALQRDLPGALQATATYLGIKGTRGVQDFLPNTYALGTSDPCVQCPSGFVYRASNGNSTREAGSVQLRRRLRSGFTATVLYTYSKSIDNDSMLGGQGPVAAGATSQAALNSTIAQNWRDLRAERSLSSFDQRHLLNATVQYTSGMGMGGGTLLGGWRGRALKEWTFLGQLTAGSGLPETPIYLAAVNGSGYTGSLRPDRTGTAVQRASVPGESGAGRHFLNANAFAAPQSGQWGDAGRNSITGPGQLTFNASLARTFRLDKRFNVDVRADTTNLLNHVVFTGYNTVLNPATSVQGSPAASSPLFGLPVAANPMRSMQLTARLRF